MRQDFKLHGALEKEIVYLKCDKPQGKTNIKQALYLYVQGFFR